MQYIHVKNLEKYHAGYKDRHLVWCKAYFTMLNSDYEYSKLDDVDRWRLIALIMLELQMKKPIPYDEAWLLRKISTNKRPIALTIKMLHNFIETVTENGENTQMADNTNVTQLSEVRNGSVTQNRIDKNRIEYIKGSVTDFFEYFKATTNQPKIKLTPDNTELIKKRLQEGYSMEDLKQAVDNFSKDKWEDRGKFMGLVYCIGKQRGKGDNLEKWLNAKDITPQRRVIA